MGVGGVAIWVRSAGEELKVRLFVLFFLLAFRVCVHIFDFITSLKDGREDRSAFPSLYFLKTSSRVYSRELGYAFLATADGEVTLLALPMNDAVKLFQ